jgi:hypothetical protein
MFAILSTHFCLSNGTTDVQKEYSSDPFIVNTLEDLEVLRDRGEEMYSKLSKLNIKISFQTVTDNPKVVKQIKNTIPLWLVNPNDYLPKIISDEKHTDVNIAK